MAASQARKYGKNIFSRKKLNGESKCYKFYADFKNAFMT
jgi:hypothetical protein